MLNATGLHHVFGAKTILNGVDLVLEPGKFVGLSGASGVGKSTLGRILAGQLTPDAGRVMVDGAPITFGPGVPCSVQYSPQASEISIDPRWKIGKVLRNGGAPDQHALDLLGIKSSWADRYPAELSGGELARVSLGRLLLPTTRYLICDEVTAPLDALAAQDLAAALAGLAQRGMAVMLISHNTGLLRRHGDRLLTLADGSLTEGA